MRRSLYTVLIGLTLCLPASAVTLAPLTFEELVNASALILDARVAHVAAQWSDDRGRIDSIVTVEVIDHFKGSSGRNVSFTIPGGQVGRYLNLVPGAPTFTVGDRAVMFLTSRGPRLPTLTGFTQGLYRVTVDSRTGSTLVAPPIFESAKGPAPRGDVRRKPVAIGVFETAVRTVQPVAQ